MAEENVSTPAVEGTETIAPVAAEPKKQRAPRQKKAAAEVAAPVATKAPRQKRGEKATKPATAADDMSAISESKPAKSRVVAAKVKPAKAPSAPVKKVVSDEFADLIALEEENKALRKALGEKLRAENADLRKKLGQA